jgi:hypothetical protein
VELKSRIVPGVLVGGLIVGGGGSVIAASGGSSSVHSAAGTQYCPPSSPGAGNPQGGPNNNCGHPKKPKKKPHFKTSRKPKKRCYNRGFTLRVKVSNKPRKNKTRAWLHGKRLRNTSKSSFTVKVRVRKLKRGVHHIKLRVRGANGKTYVRTVTFRRC